MRFLHRQRGKNSLLNLGKWLDAAEAQGARAIRGSLSTLPAGDCWVWQAGDDTPVRVHIPPKRTHHPNPRELRGEVSAPAAAADVSTFVARLEKSLTKIVEEQQAN